MTLKAQKSSTKRPRERRRVSVLRLMIVVVAVAAVVGAGSHWALARIRGSNSDLAQTTFAPYVDVTLTPVLHFEDPAEQPSNNVTLGFVVADPGDSCQPSWGTYYSLDAAARALDLDRRVVRLRERGGDATVSFGGALNHELATVCQDPDKLVAAYQSVIDRYKLTTVDFDIEGTSLADTASNTRRAAAIKQLEQKNPELRVWFTLPVAPQGLDTPSVALIDQALGNGVALTGINAMTMNYSDSRPASMSMADATQAALTSTFQQLDGAFQRAGLQRTQQQIWAAIGATPMIGQNDVAADVFTTGDAEALLAFARTVDLGRLSFWSANRDAPCGAAVSDTRVSNTCSGVSQDPKEFASIFAAGTAGSHAHVTVSADGEQAGAATPADSRIDGLTYDDPRTSPYPIWRTQKAYEADAKVVWQGRVYQAKWWTQGNQPDAPVKHMWETPWRYLGPVLESDRQAVTAETPIAGAITQWSGERVFVAGDQVQYEGKVFRAKWWTQGDVPQENPDQPYDNPWTFLGQVATPTPAASTTPIPTH